MKTKTIFFDLLKDIIFDKTLIFLNHPQFEKDFNVWMITRYLSMSPKNEYLNYCSFLNLYGKSLTKQDVYKWLVKSVPKSKNYFIKYVKPLKKTNNVDDETDESNISC